MFEILGLVAALGCKTTFIADNREYREPYVGQIQALGVEVLFHPFLMPVPEYLESEAAKFDVVILSRATVACKYVELVKRCAPGTKLIFDTVDLHFVREERQAELVAVNKDSSILRAAAERTRRQELHAMSLADITLVVSPAETTLLAKLVPAAKVKILSNVHENMPGPKPFSERDGILFIGGFRHPPNLDAIVWYVENVLPIIREKAPQLVTTIIGSNVTVPGVSVTQQPTTPVKTTLLQAGLLPTFYQFTEALIEVKLSITLKETSATQTEGRPGFAKRGVMAFAAPVNFRNASTYSHTAEGSSLLRVTMKPVPAPVRLAPDVVTINATVTPPTVTRTER